MGQLSWLPGTLRGQQQIHIEIDGEVAFNIKELLITDLVLDVLSHLPKRIPFTITELAKVVEHFDLEFPTRGFDTDSSNNYHCTAYFNGLTLQYKGGLHKIIPDQDMAGAMRLVANKHEYGEEDESQIEP